MRHHKSSIVYTCTNRIYRPNCGYPATAQFAPPLKSGPAHNKRSADSLNLFIQTASFRQSVGWHRTLSHKELMTTAIYFVSRRGVCCSVGWTLLLMGRTFNSVGNGIACLLVALIEFLWGADCVANCACSAQLSLFSWRDIVPTQTVARRGLLWYGYFVFRLLVCFIASVLCIFARCSS